LPVGIPAQEAVYLLSLHWVELVQPPHLPATHRSGAQSAFVVHAFWQLPCAPPLQVSSVPHSTCPTHAPPVWQLPPLHVPPLPQSAFAEQALVVQKAVAQTSAELVPQSAFELQLAGAVHFALAQSTPVAH
jgi:hypothetical protein